MQQQERLAESRPLVPNPARSQASVYPPALEAVLDAGSSTEARNEIGAWPGYQPTPLLALPGLAKAIGMRSLHYKDEAGRFGLGSFKALGGAYAVLRHLREQLKPAHPGGDLDVSTRSILDGKHRAATQALTVCCATDGNHGRSVAWGAQLFGCRCVIYVHQTVSEGRVDAVKAYGAEVIRHEGNYDETVQRAADDAAANGWTVVSDTSYEGYLDIPRDVMHGYTVMAQEALEQWPEAEPPSHVLVPGGVGGVAAAVCAAHWWRYGDRRPRFIVVEPSRAACLLESAANGKRTLLHGDIETVMAGLSCGEPSVLAWEVLNQGTDAFVAVTDEQAIAAMRLLARPEQGDVPLVSGESAASVIAALIRLYENPEMAEAVGLDAQSSVLVYGTEGDTDPELYAELVGLSAREVREAASS